MLCGDLPRTGTWTSFAFWWNTTRTCTPRKTKLCGHLLQTGTWMSFASWWNTTRTCTPRKTMLYGGARSARVGRERKMQVGPARVEAVDINHPRIAESRSDMYTVAERRRVASKLSTRQRETCRAAGPAEQLGSRPRHGLEKPILVVHVNTGLDSVVVGVLAKRKVGRRPRRLFGHRDVYAICAHHYTVSSAAQQRGFTNPLTPLMRLYARPAHQQHCCAAQTQAQQHTPNACGEMHTCQKMPRTRCCTSKRPTPCIRNSCVRWFVVWVFYAHLVLCATSRGTFLCSIGMLGISYSLFRNSVGPHKRPFSSCLMYFFLCALGKADKIALRYQLGCVCSGHSCVLWP